MKMEPDSGGIPEPEPWYRTQLGETVISLALIVPTLVCWQVSQLLSAPFNEVVAGVGVLCMLGIIYFSGRAATKVVDESVGRD